MRPLGPGWLVDHGPLYAWEEREADAREWAWVASTLREGKHALPRP